MYTTLDRRKQRILYAIIKEYLETAEPVGSGHLFYKFHFDISPATIRNEMKFLEEAGFIKQPFTSAGRIPTDKGYRYYVDRLMKKRGLTLREQAFINSNYRNIEHEMESILHRTLNILSFLSNYATFIAAPKIHKEERVYSYGITNILKLPEFRETDHLRPVLKLLEQEDILASILSEYSHVGETIIKIGSENKYRGIKECSVIVSSYQFEEYIAGIGVIGPTRMFYNRTSTLVESISKKLSEFLAEEEA